MELFLISNTYKSECLQHINCLNSRGFLLCSAFPRASFAWDTPTKSGTNYSLALLYTHKAPLTPGTACGVVKRQSYLKGASSSIAKTLPHKLPLWVTVAGLANGRVCRGGAKFMMKCNRWSLEIVTSGNMRWLQSAMHVEGHHPQPLSSLQREA